MNLVTFKDLRARLPVSERVTVENVIAQGLADSPMEDSCEDAAAERKRGAE